MDLSPRTETFQQDDQSWLGSEHGTSMCRPITLDVSKFTAGTHYPNGYIPSGVALGLITATGKYGPYDDTQTDGRQTLAGHLFTAQKVGATSAVPIVGALYEHGRVVQSKLPFQSGAGSVDANGKADVKGQIIYV